MACTDCTNNCALLHQEPTSKITRFFKVMFGKDHDKVMPLPPDIAPSVEQLAGETFLLEDADGRKCPVLLTHFEGSLAFTEGWSSFFREHDLEETSFLTFEHTEGSEIIFVRVFAKSGGETVHYNRKGYFRRRVSSNEADPVVEENLNDDSSPEIMVLESDKDEVEVEMVSPIEASMGIQGESDMFDAGDKSGEDGNVNRILAIPEAMKIPDKIDIGSAAKATDKSGEDINANRILANPEAMKIPDKIDMGSAAKATDKSGEVVNANRILANPEAMKIPDKIDMGSAAKATDSDFDSLDKVIEIEEDCTLETPDAEAEVDKPKEKVKSLEKAARGSNVRITEQNKRNMSSQNDPVLGLPVSFAGQNKRKFRGEPMKKVIERKKSSGLKVNASKIGNKSETKAKGRKNQMAANHIDGDDDRSLGENFTKAAPNKQPKDGNLSKKIPDFGRDSRNRRSRQLAAERMLIEERDKFVGSSPGKQYGRKRPIPKKRNSAILKVDPSLSDDEHQKDADDFFSVVVTSREYLDLPIEGALTGHMFYLKDPNGIDWPVVCRGIQYQKQLAANWDLFCSANNISEGDTCKFSKVGNSSRSYRVDVARRSAS